MQLGVLSNYFIRNQTMVLEEIIMDSKEFLAFLLTILKIVFEE